MSDVTIDLLDTYVGMPDTMQGGYVAGLAAGDSNGPIRFISAKLCSLESRSFAASKMTTR